MSKFDTLLPASWIEVELRELTDVNYGKALSAGARVADGRVPVIGSSGVVGRHDTALVAGPCLVIGRKGAAGSVHLVRESSWPIDTAYFIQPPREVDLVYLSHVMGTRELGSLDKSTAIPSLGRDDLYRVQIPIAPSNEQTRIVEKLEELLSDLDAGVAELKAAQKKLAQYRQSLLKAAVEGALTAEWRQQNPPTETGAQLLQRILTERRARWEAKQHAKFQEQGKTPPKDWQKKYPEPLQPNTSDLPELPQGWVWACLDALIDDGPQNGIYLPASQYGKGIPILRIDDYQIGWHRSRSDLNLVDADEKTAKMYALNVRDLVINRVNSMTHLGKSLCIGDAMAGVLFESNMMRLRLSEHVAADYVTFYLGSDLGRERLTSDAKWAVNQASINQQDVRRTPVPFPSQVEQQRITELLSSQHEAMEQQSTAIGIALKQSTAQRQNILRAAFAGQLVPQDPADEPASVLLERIRAERAAPANAPQKARRTRVSA